MTENAAQVVENDLRQSAHNIADHFGTDAHKHTPQWRGADLIASQAAEIERLTKEAAKDLARLDRLIQERDDARRLLAEATGVVSDADGVAMIAAERRRQIEEEGWTAEHDDIEHQNGELGRAAAAYALAGMKVYQLPVDMARNMRATIVDIWPWGREWFKPRGKPSSTIRTLVKAGALIAAEIDQQKRRAALQSKEAGE